MSVSAPQSLVDEFGRQIYRLDAARSAKHLQAAFHQLNEPLSFTDAYGMALEEVPPEQVDLFHKASKER